MMFIDSEDRVENFSERSIHLSFFVRGKKMVAEKIIKPLFLV